MYRGFAIVACLLSFTGAGTCLGAEPQEKAKDGEGKAFYVLEVQDCFVPPAVGVATADELKAAQKEAMERSRAIPLAFRQVSKVWAEAEKKRVEDAREEAKEKKQSVRIFKQPFLLKEPGMISVRGDGPFETLDEAVQKAEGREAAVAKEVEFAAASEKRKLDQMSEQSRKSYEEQTKLIEQQKTMFLSALESLAGKSSLIASETNIKRMGGKITKLVTNTHRMQKPGPSAATATKVDPRAVTK